MRFALPFNGNKPDDRSLKTIPSPPLYVLPLFFFFILRKHPVFFLQPHVSFLFTLLPSSSPTYHKPNLDFLRLLRDPELFDFAPFASCCMRRSACFPLGLTIRHALTRRVIFRYSPRQGCTPLSTINRN